MILLYDFIFKSCRKLEVKVIKIKHTRLSINQTRKKLRANAIVITNNPGLHE